MVIFQFALVLSAFLCSLVAGFLFAYAIAVMPGIKNLDVDSMDETGLKAARNEFEPRWNTTNRVRTVMSCCTSAVLIILLFRL